MFRKFYPEFNDIFQQIIRENCTIEFEAYQTIDNISDAPFVAPPGSSVPNQLALSLSDCILRCTSEYIKANMGSASVILGLTPTILATMGNSVEEISTLMVVGRRPFLGFILAFGAPAVAPALFFQYMDPWALLLVEQKYRPRPKQLSYKKEIAVIVLEYIFGLAVITNNIQLSLQLGVMVCHTFAPHLSYLTLLWSILVLVIHVSGTWALWSRTKPLQGWSRRSLWVLFREQFQPLRKTTSDTLHFCDETYLFLSLKWFASLFTIWHIIYGTLLFSSMLFISITDGLRVIGRFMASALVCRFILMYKLSLLRDYHVGEEKAIKLQRFGTSNSGEEALLNVEAP